ncbi:MAG: hypothetical protein MZW92_12190 [Comamonadaceae bacterium]|nr:hypothetical protein [Comamonadaceae bacterium]
MLDIPARPDAPRCARMPEAQRLKKLFEYVAARLGLAARRGDHRRPPADRPRHRPGAGGARRDAGAATTTPTRRTTCARRRCAWPAA